jgi:predicted ATPase
MISEVRIRNVKRFVDQSFRFAPLTVLTGLNSSGKSTIIQALLLAYQSKTGRSEAVALNAEPGLRLGQPADVLAVDAPTTRIEVGLEMAGSWRNWVFETHFEGSETASHLICIDNPDADISLTYLGAERVGPRTSQAVSPTAASRDDDTVHLGDDGRFTAHALAVHGRREVSQGLLHPSQSRVTTLHSQAESWMSELVGTVQFEARLIPRTDLATLHVRSTGAADWYLPTNVGFGISYALPIIVAGLAARPGSLLIIDSPEAHLHPAAQSTVARFLTLVAACGVQVVVETHSDHVLNGIRRAVVENVAASENVVVHFLSGDREPVVIELDARGKPTAWPDGFFDQLEVDLRHITRPRPRRPHTSL